jgi:hypothetical protein
LERKVKDNYSDYLEPNGSANTQTNTKSEAQEMRIYANKKH